MTNEEPVVPSPNGTEPTEPQLQRDRAESINETLKRLKENEEQKLNQTRIKTASALPTNQEIRSKSLRRQIIVIIFLLIALVGATIVLVSLNKFDFSQPTPIFSNSVSGEITTITPNLLEDNLNESWDGDRIIKLKSSNNYPNDSEVREYFQALELYFDQRLIGAVISGPIILVNEETYVIGFSISDYPNTARALRDWEEVARLSQALVSNSNLLDPVDITIDEVDFRTVSTEISYTILDKRYVFIGSNPEIILDKASKVRAHL